MNKNPTVSIIVPTYNRTHLVGKIIQSVLNQIYQDIKLFITSGFNFSFPIESILLNNQIYINYCSDLKKLKFYNVEVKFLCRI